MKKGRQELSFISDHSSSSERNCTDFFHRAVASQVTLVLWNFRRVMESTAGYDFHQKIMPLQSESGILCEVKA